MSARGDFRGLENLRKKLEALSGQQARQDMIRVCSEAAVKILDDQFNASVDPYGKPWAPLTSRSGKPLLDTGTHLKNTLNPKIMATGFVISTAFVGAAVHQYGATIYPKRGKYLRFQVSGAPTASNPRGNRSGFIYAKKVVIPRRQYMPEGDIGPKWKAGLEHAADELMRKAVGQ